MNSLRTRFAIPLALVGGAIVFFVLLNQLLNQAYWPFLPAVVVSLVVCLIAAAGLWFVLDSRPGSQVEIDAYSVQAETELFGIRRQADRITDYARRIEKTDTAQLLRQTHDDLIVLLDTLEKKNPNARLSAATVLNGHMENLLRVLDQYVDIEQRPRFFDNPDGKKQQAEEGIKSFDTFLINSVKLLEQGDNIGFEAALKMLQPMQYTALS